MNTSDQSTKPHPNAEILRAIADGKTVEWKDRGFVNWSEFNPYSPSRLNWLITPNGSTDIQWRIKPEPITAWINLYQNGTGSIWLTKEEADNCANINRIACIQISYTPGEGIS
jgi:hypothetical protein